MGTIIQAYTFSPEVQDGLFKPIIYCCSYGDLESEAISINMLLAEKLVKVQPNRRPMQLEKCFNQVLNTLHDGVVIKDFEVMFNLEYQLDLLRFMVVACKIKPFSIMWPGKCEGGKLFYAKEGYQDYMVFNIEDYDVTCIV